MSKQPQSCPGYKTMIGGQALLEGIMMLGPSKRAMVCRKPDGTLAMEVSDRKLIKDRYPILGLPFLRGVVGFGSSMANGVKALMWSAEFYPEEEGTPQDPSKFDLWLEKKLGSEKALSVIITLAAVLGVAFSVGLFFVLPTLLTGGVLHFFPGFPLWGRNLLEGLCRIVIFLLYLFLCSRMKDIRRTFQYHGAEHKTIFCYEKGLELTVENVRQQPRQHPRCGTSFLFVVIVVSILFSSVVFTFVDGTNALVRVLVHLALLIPVVGVTYEFNRYVGRHDNPVTNFLAKPGLWMQNFTTFEPDDSMLEVAIEALVRVLPKNEGDDAW